MMYFVYDSSFDHEVRHAQIQKFLQGELCEELRSRIELSVSRLVSQYSVDLICFAPSQTMSKTILRFGELAMYLSVEQDCDVYLDAVTLPEYLNDKSPPIAFICSRDRIHGRNVLIICDLHVDEAAQAHLHKLLKKAGANIIIWLYIN